MGPDARAQNTRQQSREHGIAGPIHISFAVARCFGPPPVMRARAAAPRIIDVVCLEGRGFGLWCAYTVASLVISNCGDTVLKDSWRPLFVDNLRFARTEGIISMSGHRNVDDAYPLASKDQLGKAIASAVSNHPGDYKAALAEFSNAVSADDLIKRSILLGRSAQVLRTPDRVAPEMPQRVDAFMQKEKQEAVAKARPIRRRRGSRR